MKAGIIAAGTGERLAQGGISIPKPLVPIAGEPMIARVVRAAAELKVTGVACVVNDLNPEVARYLQSGSWPVPVELVVKTTPNSMESLFSLAPLLDREPFILFTVDAVFSMKALKAFLSGARGIGGAEGVLALTGHVDDEKPLWVKVDSTQRVIIVGDAAGPGPFVTAGFYYFSPQVFKEMGAARHRNLGALRQFLALLVEKGYAVYGFPVSKTVDVDYPEDIAKAEAFLREIADDC